MGMQKTRLGVHVSIAGGLHLAVERARRLGCDSFQMFLSNPRSWRLTPILAGQVEQFRSALGDTCLSPVVVHLPYLPNLASTDPETFRKSVHVLKLHLDRCEALGAHYLVVHMGKGEDHRASRLRMVEAIKRAWGERPRGVCLLLENTAGQGREIGYTLEDLFQVFERISLEINCGLCIDSCHAFAAGYAIHLRKGLDEFISRIEHLVGLEKIRIIHLNDSLKPLGSRVDRHAHIGKGEIGANGLRRIVNHPAFCEIPMILETPRKNDQDDLVNLAAVRSLMRRK